MIKKLRNQPYAPKSGTNSQIGAKRKTKIFSGNGAVHLCDSHDNSVNIDNGKE
jgi:hypothetical protein